MSPLAIDLIRTIVAIGLGFLAMAIASEAIDVFRFRSTPMTAPTKAENPSAIQWAGEIAIFAAIAWSITTAGMATMSVFYGTLSWLAIPIFIVPQLTVAIYALLAQRSKQP